MFHVKHPDIGIAPAPDQGPWRRGDITLRSTWNGGENVAFPVESDPSPHGIFPS